MSHIELSGNLTVSLLGCLTSYLISNDSDLEKDPAAALDGVICFFAMFLKDLYDEISARPSTVYFAIAYFLRELMESFENPKTLEEIEALLKSLTDTSLEFIKQVREDNK